MHEIERFIAPMKTHRPLEQIQKDLAQVETDSRALATRKERLIAELKALQTAVSEAIDVVV